MTAAPVSAHPPRSAGSTRRVLGLSVGLAAAGVLAVVHSLVIYRFAIAVGGPYATDDNWVGIIVGLSMAGGVVASLAAFVMAVVAKVRHLQSRLLWVPLSVFPTVLAFLVLGEAFWWE